MSTIARLLADSPQPHRLPVATEGQATLRMACAMWIRDPATTLTLAQSQWLRTHLASHAPFTTPELRRLGPELLAWARALDARLGAVIQGLLPTVPPEVPDGQS
jgi:hypothetical protein